MGVSKDVNVMYGIILQPETIRAIADAENIDISDFKSYGKREMFVLTALDRIDRKLNDLLKFEDTQNRYSSDPLSIVIYARSSFVNSYRNKLGENLLEAGLIGQGNLKIKKSEAKALKKFQKFYQLEAKPEMVVMGKYL